MPPSAGLWTELRDTLAAVERWLLPPECLVCRRAVPEGQGDPLVCALCRSRWVRLPEPVCGCCGQPLTPGLDCRLCSGWPPGLTGVRSAVWLDDSARRAVHLLKYEGWPRVAECLAEAMQPLVADRGATLVAVPLGTARERERGYNQAAEIARALGRAAGVAVAERALRRRRETGTQTMLTPEERRANLAGAFEPAGAAPRRPVLVDDVFTTGATLAEAAAALLAAGAERVGGITFARAPRPLARAAEASIRSEA